MIKLDAGLRLIAILIVDVLNPLFVISLALFASLGYIFTLLMPVTIDVWQAVFWVCTVIPFIGLSARVYAKRKQGAYAKSRTSWRMLLPFIPLLVLAHSLIVEFSNPYMQVRVHGDLYSGYMQQLLYGATPIESYYAAGYPANHYWLYHAYVATVAKIASWPLLYASEIVNFIALFSGLLWIAQTLVALKLAKPRTVYLGLLVLFVYCSVNSAGMLNLLAHLASGADMPNLAGPALRLLLLEGADIRLHSMLGKILNASSITAAIAAFCAVLCVCAKMIKGSFGLLSLVLISAGGLASLAAQPAIALYVAAVLGGLAITAVVYLLTESDRMALTAAFWHEVKNKISPAALWIWLALSLVLSLPLLKYAADLSYNLRTGFELFHPANLSMIGAALVLPLPLFFFQCAFVWQRKNALRWFIVISAIIALGITSGLLATDQNQYKGVYPTAVLTALSGLFTLEMMQNSRKNHWRRIGWLFAGILIVLTLSRMIYINVLNFHRSRYHTLRHFEYEGPRLRFNDDSGESLLAYYWLREHSPFNSIIVVDPSPAGVHRLSNLLHERMLYVKKGAYKGERAYVDGILDYDERIRGLELFYSGNMNADDYQKLLERMTDSLPGRPLYAVVKDEEVSPEVMRRRGARLVYEDENDDANVYWLNPQE